MFRWQMRLIEHVHSHTNQIVLAGLNVKMFEYYEYLNVSAVKFVSSHVNFIQFNDASNKTLSAFLIAHSSSHCSCAQAFFTIFNGKMV